MLWIYDTTSILLLLGVGFCRACFTEGRPLSTTTITTTTTTTATTTTTTDTKHTMDTATTDSSDITDTSTIQKAYFLVFYAP